jgi:hypothetical protein
VVVHSLTKFISGASGEPPPAPDAAACRHLRCALGPAPLHALSLVPLHELQRFVCGTSALLAAPSVVLQFYMSYNIAATWPPFLATALMQTSLLERCVLLTASLSTR